MDVSDIGRWTFTDVSGRTEVCRGRHDALTPCQHELVTREFLEALQHEILALQGELEIEKRRAARAQGADE